MFFVVLDDDLEPAKVSEELFVLDVFHVSCNFSPNSQSQVLRGPYFGNLSFSLPVQVYT